LERKRSALKVVEGGILGLRIELLDTCFEEGIEEVAFEFKLAIVKT
jgi:hypothetical protein